MDRKPGKFPTKLSDNKQLQMVEQSVETKRQGQCEVTQACLPQ